MTGLLTTMLVSACSDTTGTGYDGTTPSSTEDFTTADGDAAKLFASDGGGNWFGNSVSVSGQTVIVGGTFQESAYVFEGSEGSWTEVASLTPVDVVGEFYARQVAGDGDVVIVSDPIHEEDSGIAYVFERSDGSWTRTAELVASDAATGDRFGFSVDVSGNVAVVGAVGDDAAAPAAGSAYVFEASGDSWTEVAKLTAGDADGGEDFGHGIAVDGTVVLIGAPQEDDLGRNSGSAYVFEKTNDSWTQVVELTADDGEEGDRFGTLGRVAVDGDLAIIGAPEDDDGGTDSGSAYVFERVSGSWTQVAKLTASDAASEEHFGHAVDIDGGTAVVTSAPGVATSGSAYLFDGGSGWSQVAEIRPSDWEAGDYFGVDVAIGGDVLVVGARGDDDVGSGLGAAYVFDISTF